MLVVRGQRQVEVAVGTSIDLVVTRPVAPNDAVRYEWPDAPSVEGNAVRFRRLRIELPAPEDDGGVTTHHYELEAVGPGTARVVVTPRGLGPSAGQGPVHLDVVVR